MIDHPTKCERALDWIELALRDRLSREARERLESHLATCPSCRGAEADARRVREALRGLESPRCPDRVVARILAATSAPPATTTSTRAVTPSLGLAERFVTWLGGAVWRPALATAAAVLAIVAVVERAGDPASDPTGVRGAEATARASNATSFCEGELDSLLATVDLGELEAEEARRAAEEACLAFEIFARVMNVAAGVAERGVMERLKVPLRKGVSSGVDRLAAPLRRPEHLEPRG